MPLKHHLIWNSYAGLQSAGAHPLCSIHAHRLPAVRTSRSSVPTQSARASSHASNLRPKDKAHQDDNQELHWPTASPGAKPPTPYEIFKQKKGAPYSKRRFYELVKIYHPDRTANENAPSDCPMRAMRLERYRLIVAANEILSDPVKRDAYDRWGAGWHGTPEVTPWSNQSQGGRTGWSGFNQNQSAANNATWEDWERWHHRQNNPEQKPVYFSNGSFVVVIIVCAGIGAVVELSRAKEMSKQFMQQIEDKHSSASKHLMQSRRDSRDLPTQERRVQQFLTARGPRAHGPGAYGVLGPQGAQLKRLPPPEVCGSGETQAKSSEHD